MKLTNNLIIGAGIAGIASGYELKNNNLDSLILEKNKRPVSAVADNSEFRDIEYVEISENKNVELKMLFDPKTNLEERIINEQFIY